MILFCFPTIAQEELDWRDYLELKDSHFKHKKKRNNNRIEYLPRFRNVSDDKIIEIKFTTKFFHEGETPVYQMNGKIVQNLKPNRNTSKKEFYVFPDNPFNSNDTYDQLLSLTDAEGKIERVFVKTIKFENGKMLNFQ